ncbi:MAG: TPM domain-containing protein, partial [Patescibacteria group bacterium]|nr:TPM domain-containing protein [Patescibacteria group bacterium]
MRYWLGALLFALPLAAQAYVSPCSPDGFVNDFAGVISAQEEQQLEALLSEYASKTGNEIAVATVNSFGDETPETYAVRLYEEWGLGAEGRDNGALFAIAVADRLMRIEVGYGLEGDLTDA